MKQFILELLGYDPREMTILKEANAGLQAQLDTRDSTISSLRTLLTEQKDTNAKLYAYNRELEKMNQKLSNDLDIANTNYKILADQKAEIEQERLQAIARAEKSDETAHYWMSEYNTLHQQYDAINQTLDEVWNKWQETHLNPLKRKLSQVQGRLGAYIKKYGELPHRRENERNRKKAPVSPAPVSGASAPDNTPTHETNKNPTAN